MKNESKRTGQLIKEIRIARDMSQMELSELIGVSYQQVQKYEKGSDNISVERLKQIAKALGVPITRFFLAASEGVAEPVAPYGKMPEDEALLLQRFRRIRSRKAKHAVLELLKTFTAG